MITMCYKIVIYVELGICMEKGVGMEGVLICRLLFCFAHLHVSTCVVCSFKTLEDTLKGMLVLWESLSSVTYSTFFPRLLLTPKRSLSPTLHGMAHMGWVSAA